MKHHSILILCIISVNKGQKEPPGNIYANLNDHDFLLRIGALIKEKGKYLLRSGAVLFFGNISDIRQLFPCYFLDYQEAETKQTRWDRRIVSDDYTWNGNLYNFFNLVSKNITQGLPNPFRTDGISNLNGRDIKRSVIEGLVNAITNCDFSLLPGIVIKKTHDNITITNSGDIPVGIDQAKIGGISNPLNRNIRNYFRILQVSDRAGSGIPNIFQVFRSYHFPEPELTVNTNPIKTTLHLSFIQLNNTTGHQEEKLKILGYLSSHQEGASRQELANLIGRKTSGTNLIVTELLSSDRISTNGKKTKGKRYFIREN